MKNNIWKSWWFQCCFPWLSTWICWHWKVKEETKKYNENWVCVNKRQNHYEIVSLGKMCQKVQPPAMSSIMIKQLPSIHVRITPSTCTTGKQWEVRLVGKSGTKIILCGFSEVTSSMQKHTSVRQFHAGPCLSPFQFLHLEIGTKTWERWLLNESEHWVHLVHKKQLIHKGVFGKKR